MASSHQEESLYPIDRSLSQYSQLSKRKESRLFESCAILGGTLIPHTLYLGSGLVQARLHDFGVENSSYHEAMTSATSAPSTVAL